MPADNSRTMVIVIKGPLPHDECEALALRVRDVLHEPELAVSVQLVEGADRIYVGSRPDKRARLEAIQALPETMTSTQVAARLGLSERQVRRYRSLLSALSGEEEGGHF